MNDLHPPPEDAPPQLADAQDDAFDDTYAWVGYESAHPLPVWSVPVEVWPGTVKGFAD
jgi:hypothetical protein